MHHDDYSMKNVRSLLSQSQDIVLNNLVLRLTSILLKLHHFIQYTMELNVVLCCIVLYCVVLWSVVLCSVYMPPTRHWAS